MRGPNPPMVELSVEERHGLETLIRRHTTPQQTALRARIVITAADGFNNAQIGRLLDVDTDTARLWRNRWLGLAVVSADDLDIEGRLEDASRPGAPRRITSEQECQQECQIVALACEAPGQSSRPISQWTSREIADEIVNRGIVESISPRHAARLLKRGT